jgi:hypothetical protein
MAKDIEAYCKYMEKKAAVTNPFNTLWQAFAAGGTMTWDAMTAGLALAALAGGATGFAASKISSPGKKDFRNVQRQFIKEKLTDDVSQTAREQQLDDAYDQSQIPETPKPKSMRL